MSSIEGWDVEAFTEFYSSMLEEARDFRRVHPFPEDFLGMAERAVDKNDTLGWFCTLEGSIQALRFTRNPDAWVAYWDPSQEDSTVGVFNRFAWYALREDLVQDLEAEA